MLTYLKESNSRREEIFLDDAPKFEISFLKSDLYSIRFRGRLPVGWLGNLALGLSDKKINIETGFGKMIESHFWEGELQVRPLVYLARFENYDIMELMEKGASTAARSNFDIKLRRFQLSDDIISDNGLVLEIDADDSLGFLAGLSAKLAFYSLFPAELKIETYNNRVHDEFRLKGLGGGLPSESVRESFLQTLEQLVE